MLARRPERLAGVVLAAVIAFAALQSLFGNPRWGWDVFAQWFFAEPIMLGLGRTLLLTALGALFGFALGAILALARVIADTVLIMKAGRILEAGPPAQVLDAPRHPRTAEFLSKVL